MKTTTATRRLIHFRRWVLALACALTAATALAAGPSTATFEGGAPVGFFSKISA